ncbi:MAG: protein kinase [Acidobacteriota bacterium]
MTPERLQQIAQLFDEALELEPQRRATFLAEACAADDGLRREVETLLRARDRAGDFLNRDAAEIEASLIAAERAIIPAGQRIGHFEVIAPLGAGAMGEVYLARDTRLERQVALKLLPARFTSDAARLRRFEREARAASALNHPNIITVYETGADGEHHFISTEFVAGQTLRARLANGPLPPAEAIAIAVQIAAALKAAHAAGIIHRDIKPENVMLRSDYTVKVLDFGIAKLVQTGAPIHGLLNHTAILGLDENNRLSGDNEAVTPLDLFKPRSAANHSTEQGAVIGTPGYMSPEQARGFDVDARTDVFSLGVVLYEMIAGQVPFRGATHTDMIVTLLEREPEPLADASIRLNWVVARALAKGTAQRYQSMDELYYDLHTSLAELSIGAAQYYQPTQELFSYFQTPPTALYTAYVSLCTLLANPRLLISAGPRFSARALMTVGLLTLILAVGLWWLAGSFAWPYNHRLPEHIEWGDQANLRYSQLLSAKIGFRGDLSRPSFSPDGKWLAYCLRSEGRSQINAKEIGGEVKVLLTEGAWEDSDPVWSPDGQQLAFYSDRSGKNAVWTVPFPQGEPTLLKEVGAEGRVVAWMQGSMGERIYYEAAGELFAFNLASKETVRIGSIPYDFAISPDQRNILYFEQKDYESSPSLYQRPLSGGDATVLLRPGLFPSLSFSTIRPRSPIWFPDGEKIAFQGVDYNGKSHVCIMWIDSGQIEQIAFDNKDCSAIAIAPNGNLLAAIFTEDRSDIVAQLPIKNTEVEYVSVPSVQLLHEISPDSKKLVYQTNDSRKKLSGQITHTDRKLIYQANNDDIRDPSSSIFIKSIIPPSEAIHLSSGVTPRWSPNGKSIAFLSLSAMNGTLTYGTLMHASSLDTKSQSPLSLSTFAALAPYCPFPFHLQYSDFNWSSDGKRIAYSSQGFGPSNVIVTATDPWTMGSQQLTANTDEFASLYAPIWSPNSQQLAYITKVVDQATKQLRWSINVLEESRSKSIIEREFPLHLIGWSATADFLFVAVGESEFELRTDAELLAIRLSDLRPKRLAHIADVYLPTIKLAHDGRTIALVTRRSGCDNIETVAVVSGKSKRLTDNDDPLLFYSGLQWSADQSLFYSKQMSERIITLIEKVR